MLSSPLMHSSKGIGGHSLDLRGRICRRNFEMLHLRRAGRNVIEWLGISRWRVRKPALADQVGYWYRQLQLTLGLDVP